MWGEARDGLQFCAPVEGMKERGCGGGAKQLVHITCVFCHGQGFINVCSNRVGGRVNVIACGSRRC